VFSPDGKIMAVVLRGIQVDRSQKVEFLVPATHLEAAKHTCRPLPCAFLPEEGLFATHEN